jgi:hypothetical protein
MKETLSNFQFRQDNALVHKAQDIMRWFEQNDVRVMELATILPRPEPD